ncbi:MAG: hypothetical protein DHS20C01_29930 [marine bacterium B5-7]|nr:MAG: hypothetical protein DHS20C01_29930 [marine bacterium B5-7]
MKDIGIAVLIIIVLIGLFQLVTLFRARRTRGRHIGDLGDEAVRLLAGRQHALVYLYSPVCAPCRAMTPVIDTLMDAGEERIIKVDVLENAAAAQAFKVRATPTLVRVIDSRIDNVYLGAKSEQTIQSLLP